MIHVTITTLLAGIPAFTLLALTGNYTPAAFVGGFTAFVTLGAMVELRKQGDK